MSDVKNPSYYNRGKIEVWEFIEDQGLDYHTGNAVKYIARAGFKDPSKEVEDLQKAVAFLERKIKVLNGTTDTNTGIKTFLDYKESVTENQNKFLKNKFDIGTNALSESIDSYKREPIRYTEKQCIKWLYSIMTYANLIKDEQVEQKTRNFYKELKAIGVL